MNTISILQAIDFHEIHGQNTTKEQLKNTVLSIQRSEPWISCYLSRPEIISAVVDGKLSASALVGMLRRIANEEDYKRNNFAG